MNIFIKFLGYFKAGNPISSKCNWGKLIQSQLKWGPHYDEIQDPNCNNYPGPYPTNCMP